MECRSKGEEITKVKEDCLRLGNRVVMNLGRKEERTIRHSHHHHNNCTNASSTKKERRTYSGVHGWSYCFLTIRCAIAKAEADLRWLCSVLLLLEWCEYQKSTKKLSRPRCHEGTKECCLVKGLLSIGQSIKNYWGLCQSFASICNVWNRVVRKVPAELW